MLRSGCWFALWWLLVSVEAAEREAAVDYDNTTSLFRAAETDVLRFRRSRDENGKGDESYLRDALAKYTILQQQPDYATSLNEETHVLVLDSCEFCHRTLGEYDAALRYAKQLADSRLCQLDADGCFASGACTPAVAASLCPPHTPFCATPVPRARGADRRHTSLYNAAATVCVLGSCFANHPAAAVDRTRG